MISENRIVLRDRITSHMTDEEFFWFCQENRDLRIERNNKLEIIIRPPTGTMGGYQSGELFSQLSAWNKKTKAGRVFDSSTGFTLPDRSVLSRTQRGFQIKNGSWFPKPSVTNLRAFALTL